MSRIVCHCATCENPIYEGDLIYEIDGKKHHKDCIDDYSTIDIIDLLGITKSEILDRFDIYAFEAEDDTDAVKAEYEEDFFRYYE